MLLERVTDGDGEPIVVVIDFLGTASAGKFGGQSAGKLSQVLAARSAGRRIYQADPVSDLTGLEEYLDLPALAVRYCRACEREGIAGTRVTVVGHCASAALAMLVAQRLAGHGRTRVVLVQPTLADWDMIGEEFSRIRASLKAAGASAPVLSRSPRSALDEMERVLRQDLAELAGSMGLADSTAMMAELLDRYRAWLGFLLGTSEALLDRHDHALRPVVIVGADETATVPWTAPQACDIRLVEFYDDAVAGQLAECILR